MAQRYAFIAEWLDPQSGLLWKYQLFFYPDTSEVEMFDIKNRRHFLRKVRSEDVKLEQLYIGATVTIYSRQLKIVEYGDTFTQSSLTCTTERTLAMIKPDATRHLGKLLNVVLNSGFLVSQLKICQLTRQDAERFYAEHEGKPFFPKLTQFMSSGPIVAMELVGDNAISRWRTLLGPTDSNKARLEAPTSIRATFGTDGSFNACHGSDRPESASREVDFFFGHPGIATIHSGGPSTLAIIKPHALKEKTAGLILDVILDHFSITGLQLFNLDRITSSEFYEVYKGVVSPTEFSGMVSELTSGPCLAAEVTDRDGAEAVEPFREICGPADPEIGRVLRKNSIRAQFGTNKVLNAIQCTDLPEDGQLEVDYFFKILQKS